MRVLLFALAVIMALTPVAPGEAHASDSIPPARFSDQDLAALATLQAPAVSADGRRVALIISRPDLTENRTVDSLTVVDTRTRTLRELAHGTLKSPQYSPGGERIAFLEADAESTWQLRVVGVDAATVNGEAAGLEIKLPREAGVQSFAWSPDGQSIAYLAREAPRMPEGAARFDLSFEVAEADYLGTSYLDRSAGPAPTRLWLVDTHGGAPRMLQVASGTLEQLAWHPDGRAIFVNAHPGTSIVADRLGTISQVDVASGRETVVVAAPAQFSVDAPMRASAPGTLAYLSYPGPDPWLYNRHIAVVREGTPAHDVTRALDRDIGAFQWLPGGTALLAGAFDHVRNALWIVPLAAAARRVDVGSLEVESFAVARSGGAIALVASESNRPSELYFMSSVTAKPVRLTDVHAALSTKALGRVEAVQWSSDGLAHTGVLTYPPGYQTGRRYPLLVSIHGGPEMSATLAFNGDSQFFAAQDWLVFEPNYRGSSGEGERYRTAIVGDATPGAGRDIRAGIDFIKTRVTVDPHRVAVTGYSYGGVMSSWLIGHFNDWCAAMPGGVVVDFADYYDQSNTGVWIESLLGSPHLPQNHARYVEQSPVTYLPQATTPTLVLQNVGDPNAGVTQAYTLYHALKDNGVKSRLVTFAVDGHGLEDPFLKWKSNALTLAWMQEHCTPVP